MLSMYKCYIYICINVSNQSNKKTKNKIKKQKNNTRTNVRLGGRLRTQYTYPSWIHKKKYYKFSVLYVVHVIYLQLNFYTYKYTKISVMVKTIIIIIIITIIIKNMVDIKKNI